MSKTIKFCFFLVLLVACTKEGPQGPQGPAGPQGVNGNGSFSIFLGGDDQSLDVFLEPNVSRKVSLTVAGPGTIVLEASGYFFHNNKNIDYIGRASWSLDSTKMDNAYMCVVSGSNSDGFNSYHVSRGFDVTNSGTFHFYLLGNLNNSSDTIKMIKNNVVATYTPK